MHERELERDKRNEDVKREDNATPGRTSTSASLDGPTAPVPSGIIMRKRSGDGVAADAEGAVEAAASSSSGSALPTSLQRKFEGSLGVDLSSVRVHTGEASNTAAHAVSAKAYTTGQNIHFGAGQYDPSSEGGQHLIAHEVAHTVQQRGGSPTRQHKLEVSAPQDASEHEADRAADAMVTGAPAQVTGGGAAISRDKDEAKASADEGEKEMKAAAKGDLVLQVSNATDIKDAQAILAMLVGNQAKLEKGAAMISPHQRSPAEYMRDMMKGNDSKLLTQVPLEAIGQNLEIITDLETYLADARGQKIVTNEFQDQYKVLLGNYGRIEGIASKYAGTSLKNMKAGDAAGVVNDAVGAGGHRPDELKSTFQDMLAKDPALAAARENVQSSTKVLEAMPAKMSSDLTTAVSGIHTLDTAVTTATMAQKAVHSLKMREAFSAAKSQAAEAKRLTGAATELMMGGGKTAAETAAKAVVGAGALTASKWAAIAGEGAASGGTAMAWAAADKILIEPAKQMLSNALTNANAAVGVIDAGAQIDANIDAAAKEQDEATLQAFRAAKTNLPSAFDTATRTVGAWVKTAVEFEVRKMETKAAFTAFTTAIKAAAKKRGKSGEGKALAEMAGFLEEAENFVVQANTVIDIGKKGLGSEDKESLKIIEKARASLNKIKGRFAWIVHEYPFTKAGGERVTYYGAQQVYIKIIGPGIDASPAELAGKGRADGFNTDPGANGQAANQAIPGVIPQVEGMRDKVLALRNEIMAQVFG